MPEASGGAVRVRLNDFSRLWAGLGRDVLAVVEEVGARGRYILGDEVAAFERDLATYWRIDFAVGVGSGLDALEIALRGLGVAAGERVLTTPLSAFATTLAIMRVGAVPVFVDVDRNGLIDLDRCRETLRADRSIRALVPVHLYGDALDLEALAALRSEFDLRIVEDCAQSIGATWGGRSTGSIGQAAATSFYPTKNLGALGDGGAVLTASAEIAERARALRHYGQSASYAHDYVGLNSRLDELHAAILRRVFLPRLDEWTGRRRHAAQRFREGIANPAIEVPPLPPNSNPCCHLFPILVAAERRADLMEHLRRCGVESAIHYPRLITDQRGLGFGHFEVKGELEQARRFAAGEVSLPMHPLLSEEEIEHVVASCNQWIAA